MSDLIGLLPATSGPTVMVDVDEETGKTYTRPVIGWAVYRSEETDDVEALPLVVNDLGFATTARGELCDEELVSHARSRIEQAWLARRARRSEAS